MKKSYLLLLMLLTVTLTVTAKKRTRVYNFEYNSADYQAATNNREFKWTEYTYVNKILGYQDRNGQLYKTEKIVDGYDHRFAFYTTRWHWKKNYSAGYDNQYLKNNTDYTNIFSVLNLRAGDIVRIKCQDLRTTEPIGKRFITAYSANCINNRRWSVSDPAVDKVEWLKEAYHEFIMKEDGNLDLNCAPLLEIENVEIISPFTDFNYKEVTHEQFDNGGVLETEDIYINPWNKDRGNDGDPKIVWQKWEQPVVLVRGDLQGTPKAEIISGNANYSTRVRVSGLSGRGGTVVVMLERCMYTFTIPYKVADGSKAWNFWSNPLAVGRSTENGTEGPDKLSLQFHDQAYGISKRQWYHDTNASGSIYTTLYDEWMNGQNAYLNEETAGLIFFSDTNGDIEDPTNENQDGGWRRRTYGYENETTVADGGGERYLTIRKNGGFIIPDLEKGDQVYIYMVHSINAAKGVQLDNGSYKDGVKFTVTNALDALKNPITTPVCTGGSTWGPWISSGKWSRQYYGAMHFYAAAKGDMKFTFDGYEDKDYVKLCYIRIYRHDQDIITITEDMVSNTGGYEILVRQNANGTFEPTELHTLELRTTQAVGVNQQFEVLECSGNLTKDKFSGWCTTRNRGYSTNPMIYDINVNTNEPVFGAALVRGKDYDHSGQYCLDYADRIIAVGYRQTMKYPYTWDFTDIDTYSSEKFANEATAYEDTTRIWNAANGGYDLHNSSFASNNRNFAAGTQLYANDEFIEEAAGLGLSTLNQARGRNGDFNISPSGIRIQAKNAYSRVFIPEINKTCKVFVRGRKLNNGTGFAAKYAIGREIGYYKGNPETSLTRIALSEDENNVEEAFAYDGNFTNFDGFTQLGENGMAKTEVQLDDVLTVAASSSKTVEFASSGARSVNNNVGQAIFHESDAQWTESTVDGETVITNDNRIYDSTGKAIYDSDNVSLDTEHADNTYYNMVKLPGAARSEGRYITINNIPANSTVTIQAKSSGSDYRHLMVYAGSTFGSGSTFATMIARPDELVSKSFNNGENTTLCFGSERGQLNVYAVYVDGQEVGSSATADSEPYLGYAQVEVAEGSTSGLTLYLNDILIEKIGVSVDDKELNAIGWASESREYYIDHSLTEYFNNEPVKAYLATSTAKDEDNMFVNTVGLTPLTLPMQLSDGNGDPAESTQTGCIMRHDEEQQATVSIFVPDIHDYLNDETISNADFYGNACTNSSGDHDNADETKLNSMESNMMVANLTGSDVPYSETTDEYTFYVLSYRYTDGNGKTHPAEGETPTERFVRVAKGGASGKPHTAYIRLKTSDVKPENYKGDANLNIVFDINGNNSQQTDGIEDINTANGSQTQHTTGGYYTLSGQKVDNPTKPGVYVRNGKKVFVK